MKDFSKDIANGSAPSTDQSTTAQTPFDEGEFVKGTLQYGVRVKRDNMRHSWEFLVTIKDITNPDEYKKWQGKASLSQEMFEMSGLDVSIQELERVCNEAIRKAVKEEITNQFEE